MDIVKAIFNSNFFIGIVTLIAGSVALYLYIKQKKDFKKDAANIVLLEIQSAERVLSQVISDVRAGSIPNKFLLTTDSWSKYKYLFVRDFDRDQWDIITEFYDNCKLYDESVTYNNSLFQKNEEQIRVNMLKVPADYIRKYVDELDDGPEDKQKLEKVFFKCERFKDTYLSKIFMYSPQKPISDAKNVVENMLVNISLTSIGFKLKSLAGLKI